MTEMGETEAEKEGENGMIEKAARTENEMIGAKVELERGIGGKIEAEIMIMIEKEDMGETGTGTGIDTEDESKSYELFGGCL